MIDEINKGRIVFLSVFQRPPASLLLVVLLPLAVTACGAPTAPDTPANQRYWHDVGEFVVLHWDPSPGAEYYKIYYGDCSEEYPCTLLGESRSTTAAAVISESLYRDCTPENPCYTYGRDQEGTPSTNAAAFDHNLYVVACDGSACSNDMAHSDCNPRGEYSGVSCPWISPNDTASPAQRLMTPDGTTPATPTELKGKKITLSNNPDDAAVTWHEVDGATSYEVWIGSGPSSEFRLGQEVRGFGLYRDNGYEDAWNDYVSAHTPVNRGAWGEYSTTSWQVRACNMAGCSSFSDIVTLE